MEEYIRCDWCGEWIWHEHVVDVLGQNMHEDCQTEFNEELDNVRTGGPTHYGEKI
jgi:hypothetical protein